MMYVVPTPDMIIKPRHSFVDASGVVLSPYVRNWLYPRRARPRSPDHRHMHCMLTLPNH